MARSSRLRLLRLANPLVRLVLRSPAHRLLSARVLLLAYEPRQGGTRTIPVLYASTRDAGAGDTVVVLAVSPEAKRWWRAFREPAPALLRVAGRESAACGRLLGPAEAPAALHAYLARFPRAARTLGAPRNASEAELAAVAATVALVAFAPPSACVESARGAGAAGATRD